MRLIDKDNLLKLRYEVIDDVPIEIEDLTKEMIEKEPEIEAIPVDFILEVLCSGELRDFSFNRGIKEVIKMWRVKE